MNKAKKLQRKLKRRQADFDSEVVGSRQYNGKNFHRPGSNKK